MIQVDPNRSYCTSLDAPWCGEHNEPNSHVCISSLTKVISKQFGDFGWPKMTFRWVTAQNLYLPGPSWMVKEDTIMRKLRRTDAYLWNRKDFNLFPLTYNESSKWPDLKPPIYIIRDIQVLGTLTKLWKFEIDRKNNLSSARLRTSTIEHARSGHVICSGDLNSHYLPEIFFTKMCTMNVHRQSQKVSAWWLQAFGGEKGKTWRGFWSLSPARNRDKYFPAISKIFISFFVHVHYITFRSVHYITFLGKINMA